MNWSTLTSAQLRGKLGSATGRLPNKIRWGLTRVTFLNSDGSIYNRFDVSSTTLRTMKESARQHRRSFRRSRNVAYVQTRPGADWPRRKEVL